MLATKRKDGVIAILAWNLIPQPLGQRSSTGDPLVQNAALYDNKGESMTLRLALDDVRSHAHVRITRVDDASGNFRQAYEATGRPAYPTVEQIAELKRKSELKEPETTRLNPQKQISVSIPPDGLALLEIG